MPIFSPHRLDRHYQDIFVPAGVERDETGIVAEHLVQANLVGHDSHGVLRIPEYLEWMEAGAMSSPASTSRSCTRRQYWR